MTEVIALQIYISTQKDFSDKECSVKDVFAERGEILKTIVEQTILEEIKCKINNNPIVQPVFL